MLQSRRVPLSGRPLVLAPACCVTPASPSPSLSLRLFVCNMRRDERPTLWRWLRMLPGYTRSSGPRVPILVHHLELHQAPERPALPLTLPKVPCALPARGTGEGRKAAWNSWSVCSGPHPEGRAWVWSRPNLGSFVHGRAGLLGGSLLALTICQVCKVPTMLPRLTLSSPSWEGPSARSTQWHLSLLLSHLQW